MRSAVVSFLLLPILSLTANAQPASLGCNNLFRFIPDCAAQAERFSTDINAQNEEAFQCIIDALVATPRAQRINVTYPIEFTRPSGAAVDNSAVALFNRPPPDGFLFPFVSALYNAAGEPVGNSVAESLRYWKANGYSIRIPGILTLEFEQIIADIFAFVPRLPNQQPQTVRLAVLGRLPRYGLTTTGLTCKRPF